jgi:predicted Fe-S protein YdhL (DUF1289 family)
MKLRNKKTGEIFDGDVFSFGGMNSLAELNEEWEDMPEEEWRDVLGFEELYQVSNLGKVRTVKNGEAEMSQQENRNGYMTVHLRNKGVERRAMVHRLVAEAFIPNPDELRDVNHKNGNKTDNRVENLEWTTHSDNMTHSFRELGKNVRHIVQIGLDGTFIERWNSIVEASEATGICRTDIQKCCKGERTMAGAFEWKYEEDYKEPKTHWYIYGAEPLEVDDGNWSEEFINELKDTGNYFETEEEAQKAIEKLKAWKRLKDAGVSFKPTTIGHKWYLEPHASPENRTFKESQELFKDVMLFFGGEDGEE